MSEASIGLAALMAGQAVLLALIGRLRFRCLPDPETGKCVCLSGCSEIPVADQHEMIEAREYEVGQGQRVLLVSSKT